jgi:hypothetical protein
MDTVTDRARSGVILFPISSWRDGERGQVKSSERRGRPRTGHASRPRVAVLSIVLASIVLAKKRSLSEERLPRCRLSRVRLTLEVPASSHYEWQEVGRYWGGTFELLAPPDEVPPEGAVARPHCQSTSLFELVYGTKSSLQPRTFELAALP